MSKTLCEKAIDAASIIGMFYLEKNNFDYEKARDEIYRLHITKVSVKDKVFIETKRPGLLIGKRGQNIDALEKYIGMKISIVEAPASETDYLVPEPPLDEYENDFLCENDYEEDYLNEYERKTKTGGKDNDRKTLYRPVVFTKCPRCVVRWTVNVILGSFIQYG